MADDRRRRILLAAILGGALLLRKARAQQPPAPGADGTGGPSADQFLPDHKGESNGGKGEDPGPVPDGFDKPEQFFDPEMEVRRYDNVLGLDDAQRAKILKIFQDKLASFQANAKKRRELGIKTRKLHEEILKLKRQLDKTVDDQNLVEKATNDKMHQVLKGDQIQRFDEIQTKMSQGLPPDARADPGGK